jgi:hypothetical protein
MQLFLKVGAMLLTNSYVPAGCVAWDFTTATVELVEMRCYFVTILSLLQTWRYAVYYRYMKNMRSWPLQRIYVEVVYCIYFTNAKLQIPNDAAKNMNGSLSCSAT